MKWPEYSHVKGAADAEKGGFQEQERAQFGLQLSIKRQTVKSAQLLYASVAVFAFLYVSQKSQAGLKL